ncbi:hypothetical protein BDV06DRAFT_183355 [Aspergillus oleicola]
MISSICSATLYYLGYQHRNHARHLELRSLSQSTYLPQVDLSLLTLLKLLLGILAQMKGTRLDYKALAAFMGPSMTLPSAKQQINY